MQPGGNLTNSYSAGAITANSPESTARSSRLKVGNIPSFAGGVFGIDIDVPMPDVKKIIEPAADISQVLRTTDYVKQPTKLENVFSASQINVSPTTFTGGNAGFYFSPMTLVDWYFLGNTSSLPDQSKLSLSENNYHDQTKINVAGCNGPQETITRVANNIYSDSSYQNPDTGESLLPPINFEDENSLPPEYKDLIDTLFGLQTACQYVNANNTQPNYFKSNKTNAPLNAWNFDNVWVVRKDDYPKFVAAATTTTPNVPAPPGSTPTVPTNPRVPLGPAKTNTNTIFSPTVTGILRTNRSSFMRVAAEKQQVKGLKTILANVPIFIARSIPYTLIVLLLLVATLYSWQALRQYRELSVYHKNIMRILATKESVDNYLAITTHYLNTPVAIMSGSVELLLSLKKITKARADALTNKIKKFSKDAEQLLVANQVSGSQAANDEKLLKQDQANPLTVKEVWIPAVIALGLLVLANMLFIYADVFNTSPFRIAIESGLFILSVLLVALAYRYREYLESTKNLVHEQLKLESELYKKREVFIPEAVKVTSEHLESLQITGSTLKSIPEAKLFFNGLAMLEGINKGLVNLKKFAEFNTDPPLFDITSYAKKSVAKYNSIAKEKNIEIESKIDVGMVSRIQPEEIRQLIDSLLENAVKFSDKDGAVSLSIYRRFNKVVIAVSDKGVGISEHKLPSLLKPFSRGTDSMQYNYEGIGLGLYADKIIVDKLGGKISITSKLGGGTTTTVTIPANYTAKENVPVLIMPDVTPA